MLSPNPKVSIVIPCYNSGRYLRQAMESALAQDYQPLQVVAVDDGSSDDTAEILREYEGITVLTQKNQGVSAARNNGVDRADGDIVMFLDADDVLLPGSVSRKVRALQSQNGIGLVAGTAEYIDESGAPLKDAVDLKPDYPNGISCADAMRRLPGPLSGWLIPKDVFVQAGGFDPQLRMAEDWDLCLRILSAYKCVYDPIPGVQYRETPGSASRKYVDTFDQIRLVIRKHRQLSPLSKFAFWRQSRVMLLTSAAGIFTRSLRESGPRELGRFLLKRPNATPLFIAWAARAAYNRVLLLFRRGPLWQKRLALRSRI